MSHFNAEALHDTSLSPVLFARGEDRRQGARVPLSRPVRVGPAHGAPEALVSARDLSVGGMFVDADREVRVGARFSVELELPETGLVYIPEAEVAYNRATDHGAGFGVRFVDLDAGTLAAIAAEVERQTASLIGAAHSHPLIPDSDLPTLAPPPSAVRGVQAHIPTDEIRARRDQLPTEPSVAAPRPEAVTTEPTEAPEPIAEAPVSALPVSALPVAEAASEPPAPPSLPPEPDIASDIFSVSELPTPEVARSEVLSMAPQGMKDRLRRLPETLAAAAPGILLIAGLFAVSVVALLAWIDGVSPPEAVAAPATPQVDGRTHDVLMGKAQPLEVKAKADAPEADADGAKTPKKPLPPLVVLDAPKPAPKKAKTPAKPAEAKPAKAKPAKAKRAEAPPARPSPAAQALLGEADAFRIPVDAGASVRKSYTLRAPERFVVDIVGQTSPLTLPAAAGPVARVRSGRHPGFVRIVFDVDGAVKSARATLAGSTLAVHLDVD